MPDFLTLRRYSYFILLFGTFFLALLPQQAANYVMLLPFALLAVGILLSGKLSDINTRDPVLLCLILLWFGWVWGAMFSDVPYASEVTLLTLGLFPATYLFCSGRDIKHVFYSVISLSAVLSLMAVYEVQTGFRWRAQLFFGDSNTLGALIAATIPLTLSFLFAHPKKTFKILLHAALLILIGGLISTQSRSGFLGGLAGVIAVLWKNRSSFSRTALKLSLPVAALLVVGFSVTTFAHRFVLAVGLDKDVLGRFALWQSGLKMLMIDPLHGVGLGVFHLYYGPYKTANDNSSGDWVHMDPLQWGIETGWATPVMFYALCAVIAWRYLKDSLTEIQIGAGASLVTIFLVAHTAYAFHVAGLAILAGFFLAQFSPAQENQPRYRYILSVSLMIVLLSFLWSFTKTTPTLFYWSNAMTSIQRGDSQGYIDNIRECIEKGDPRFTGCRAEAARVIVTGPADPPEIVLTWLDEAERASPASPEMNIMRAQYLMRKDPKNNIDAALNEARIALEKNPTFWAARRLMVELLMQKGDYAGAYASLKQAKNWWMEGGPTASYESLEKIILQRLPK